MDCFRAIVAALLQWVLILLLTTGRANGQENTTVPSETEALIYRLNTTYLKETNANIVSVKKVGPGNARAPERWLIILRSRGAMFGTTAEHVTKEQEEVLSHMRRKHISYVVHGRLVQIVSIVWVELNSAVHASEIRRHRYVRRVLRDENVLLAQNSLNGGALPREWSTDTFSEDRHRETTLEDLRPGVVERLLPHVATGVRELHKMGIKGQGMRIGVLDTGVDHTHKALGSGCAVGSPNCPIAKFKNYVNSLELGLEGHQSETLNTGTIECASNPHGTAVSGVLIGNDTARGFVGVAPSAKLYVYRVYACDGTAYQLSLFRAIEDAVAEDKVHVISLSFGIRDPWRSSAISLFLESLGMLRPNMLVVASGGNDGWDAFSVSGPSTARNVLSVGSLAARSVLARTIVRKYGSADGETQVEADYIFGVSDPLRQSDISNVITVLRPFTTECDGETFEPSYNVQDATVVLFQGVCSPDELKEIGEFLFSVGARSILFAVSAQSLASVVARGVEAPLGGRWGRLLTHDANIMFPQGEGEFNIGSELKIDQSDKVVHIGVRSSCEKSLSDSCKSSSSPTIWTGDELSRFSSFGPAARYEIKPEVVAFGQNVLTTTTAQEWVVTDGTSLAAPYVAGCLALLVQQWGPLTANEMRSAIMSTAIPVLVRAPNGRGHRALPVAGQGAGLINVHRAFLAAPDFRVRPTHGLALPVIHPGASLTRMVSLNNFADFKDGVFVGVEHIPALSIPTTSILEANPEIAHFEYNRVLGRIVETYERNSLSQRARLHMASFASKADDQLDGAMRLWGYESARVSADASAFMIPRNGVRTFRVALTTSRDFEANYIYGGYIALTACSRRNFTACLPTRFIPYIGAVLNFQSKNYVSPVLVYRSIRAGNKLTAEMSIVQHGDELSATTDMPLRVKFKVLKPLSFVAVYVCKTIEDENSRLGDQTLDLTEVQEDAKNISRVALVNQIFFGSFSAPSEVNAEWLQNMVETQEEQQHQSNHATDFEVEEPKKQFGYFPLVVAWVEKMPSGTNVTEIWEKADIKVFGPTIDLV